MILTFLISRIQDFLILSIQVQENLTSNFKISSYGFIIGATVGVGVTFGVTLAVGVGVGVPEGPSILTGGFCFGKVAEGAGTVSGLAVVCPCVSVCDCAWPI